MLIKYNSLEKEFDTPNEKNEERIYSFVFPEHNNFANIEGSCHNYDIVHHELQMNGYTTHCVVKVAVLHVVVLNVRCAHPQNVPEKTKDDRKQYQ